MHGPAPLPRVARIHHRIFGYCRRCEVSLEKASVEAIVLALNGAGARYLIAGGLAVIAHGYLRLTVDVDVVLDLAHPRLARAIEGLATLGYRPRVPVPLEQFLVAERRAEWVREKNMLVFTLFSNEHPATEIDLFLESGLDFDTAWAARTAQELAPGLAATFVGLADLIAMKERAGRAQDKLDIENLKALLGESGPRTA